MRLKTELVLLSLLSIFSLVFMGSLWQIEISILNTVHGWEFGYFFVYLGWIIGLPVTFFTLCYLYAIYRVTLLLTVLVECDVDM